MISPRMHAGLSKCFFAQPGISLGRSSAEPLMVNCKVDCTSAKKMVRLTQGLPYTVLDRFIWYRWGLFFFKLMPCYK